MSDQSTDGIDHSLEGEYTRRVSETLELAMGPDGEEFLESTEESTVWLKQGMIECSCGERFRKSETALEHLKSVRRDTETEQ